MFDKIRYLIKLENNISDAYSNEHTKIKINSDDDLPLKKKKNMQNLIIYIRVHRKIIP